MADLKQLWRNVRPAFYSGLAYQLVSVIGRTLRLELKDFPADPANSIFCGWHGKSFIFASTFRRLGYWVIISQSKDGDMQNVVFQRLGFNVIRGSTGRGGVRAAIEAIRKLKERGTMAMTPDGPKGPSGVVQGGVMFMAHKSGAALITVGIAAKRRLVAKSWDRYIIPHPFSRAIMIAGEPLYVPADADDAQIETLRLEFERRIHEVQARADAEYGG